MLAVVRCNKQAHLPRRALLKALAVLQVAARQRPLAAAVGPLAAAVDSGRERMDCTRRRADSGAPRQCFDAGWSNGSLGEQAAAAGSGGGGGGGSGGRAAGHLAMRQGIGCSVFNSISSCPGGTAHRCPTKHCCVPSLNTSTPTPTRGRSVADMANCKRKWTSASYVASLACGPAWRLTGPAQTAIWQPANTLQVFVDTEQSAQRLPCQALTALRDTPRNGLPPAGRAAAAPGRAAGAG